jgi:protease I
MNEDVFEAKHVAILAENLYEDLELWYPKLRFLEERMLVSVIGAGEPMYRSKHGYPVRTDAAVERVEAEAFDAVLVPGGYAPDLMRRHQAMVEFIRSAFHAGKIVAAICHGGWMLASAGILKGRKVTGFSSIRDDLVHAGAIFEDRAVVRDGTLITSRTPADLPVFCLEILKALTETPAAQKRSAA